MGEKTAVRSSASLASFFFLIDMIESGSLKGRQLNVDDSEGGHTCGRMDDSL
jgi:hypothetical protein